MRRFGAVVRRRSSVSSPFPCSAPNRARAAVPILAPVCSQTTKFAFGGYSVREDDGIFSRHCCGTVTSPRPARFHINSHHSGKVRRIPFNPAVIDTNESFRYIFLCAEFERQGDRPRRIIRNAFEGVWSRAAPPVYTNSNSRTGGNRRDGPRTDVLLRHQLRAKCSWARMEPNPHFHDRADTARSCSPSPDWPLSRRRKSRCNV
jgi:hypothetical protein